MQEDKLSRQLELIRAEIKAYRTGEYPIHNLIYRLEALLNEIKDSITDEMYNRFETAWFDLEQIYAYQLYEGHSKLTPEIKDIINNALVTIEGIVQKTEKLNNSLKDGNET